MSCEKELKLVETTSTEVKNRRLGPDEMLRAIDTGATYIAGKDSKPKAIVTATTSSDGVVGKYLPSKPSGVALAVGSAFGAVPEALQRQTKGQSWLYKHSSTTQGRAGSWWAHVPIDSNGNYAVFGIGMWMVSAPTAPYLGAMMRGVIGTYLDWKAGSGVTKQGFTLYSNMDYGPNGVDVGYSATAGDWIQFAVTGHTLVLRTIFQVNGGTAVVSIDGDWSAATRLPVVTQALIDAGYFRAADLGRRYIDTGAIGIQPDRHITLAEGLVDAAHAVRIEATGLKWQAGSTGARAYVGGVVGGSASDVGQAPGTAGRVIAHVELLHDTSNFAASAMVYVPEIEKSTAGTWEFLSQTHSGETLESLAIYVDGVDKSGVAAGSWSSGAAINVKKTSTVANTDASATPVFRLVTDHLFSAYIPTQCVISWSAECLLAKRVRSAFVCNLVSGVAVQNASAIKNTRWDQCAFGTFEALPGNLLTHNDASYGRVPGEIILIGSSMHSTVAYCALLDGGRSVNHWARSAPDFTMLKDYSAGYVKGYIARSTQQLPELFAVGDKIGGVIGFGMAVTS